LKLALFGPSKSGKTYTALKLMRGIVGPDVKFAVLDTENRGSEEYQGDPDIGDFDIAPMAGNYAPDRYAKIMSDVVNFGYAGLVIDGISPAWDGPGGVQAIADANTQGQNKFSGWQVASPEHAKILQAILQCPLHLICTMRSKTEYVVEQGKPKKVGLKPVQRDGIEYEFRLLGEMDSENNLKITGRRNFQNRVIPMPGAELAKELLQYLASEQATADAAQAVRDVQDASAEGTTAQVSVQAPPTGTVNMVDPGGTAMPVPTMSVAALTAAGWTLITSPSPTTPPAPSPTTAAATVTPEPVAPPEAVTTPPPSAPSTQIASDGAGQETGTAFASPESAVGGAPMPPPEPANTNGITASEDPATKMESGQLQKIVELCQELAVIKPDKGDASWWLDWANRKAVEEYQKDFSELSRDNTAGLIARMEKTKLALKETP
jgi:hypothetical protein